MQPHLFATPPPLQLWGDVHDPHAYVTALPQLSVTLTLPQVRPWAAQYAAAVCGLQPQTLATGTTPSPHEVSALHVPQLGTVLATPQLSNPLRAPQDAPARLQNVASLSDLQPQTLGVAAAEPPQVWGNVQPVPHV